MLKHQVRKGFGLWHFPNALFHLLKLTTMESALKGKGNSSLFSVSNFKTCVCVCVFLKKMVCLVLKNVEDSPGLM